MSVRLAVSGDEQALSEVHAASFADGWTPADLKTWLTHREAFAVMAEHNGKTIAFGLGLASGSDAELLTIATAPEHRGRGWGRKIMRVLHAEATKRGLSRWVLEVARTNVSARALYESEGFVEIAVRKGYYPGQTGRVDALVMTREAGPDAGPEAWAGGGQDDAGPAYVPEATSRVRRAGQDMSIEGSSMIEQKCVEKGLRMTDQRRVIARVLSSAADHPDAEELHRRAAAVDANISLATVYRTVKLFEDSGIIERHDFRDGRSRYEEAPEEHHDHLIDAKSGKVVEFKSDEIEKLQVEIARKLGYRLIDHRLELYGVPLTEDEKK